MKEIGNYAGGIVYQTKSGNNIAASNVDGRDTKIYENPNGTYTVSVTKQGKPEYIKIMSEQDLVKNFSADVKSMNVNLSGTNSALQAMLKYGDSVANKLYQSA